VLAEGHGAGTEAKYTGEDGGQEADGKDSQDDQDDGDIDLDKELSYIQKLREKINNNSSKVTNILAKK